MGALFCKQTVENEPKKPPYDFYRCGYLRYMGFASVIASKMVPPPFTPIPQMAATAYIFSDVFNKTLASVENEEDPHRTAVTAVDAMLWQTMASVLAPLLLYGSLRSLAKLAFVRSPKAVPIKKTNPKPSPCAKPPPPPPIKPTVQGKQPVPAVVNILPGVICLMLMPFIVEPIQDTVDDVLDKTYRKWAESYLQRTELTLEERREREKARKLEAEEKRKQAEQAEKERLLEAERLAAEKAKQDALAEAQRLLKEAEAKARAREKCLEEEKLRKEKLAAEGVALREKLKQEELELVEKKAKLEKELKEKAEAKVDCD